MVMNCFSHIIFHVYADERSWAQFSEVPNISKMCRASSVPSCCNVNAIVRNLNHVVYFKYLRTKVSKVKSNIFLLLSSTQSPLLFFSFSFFFWIHFTVQIVHPHNVFWMVIFRLASRHNSSREACLLITRFFDFSMLMWSACPHSIPPLIWCQYKKMS